jgi:hypothetical protein
MKQEEHLLEQGLKIAYRYERNILDREQRTEGTIIVFNKRCLQEVDWKGLRGAKLSICL